MFLIFIILRSQSSQAFSVKYIQDEQLIGQDNVKCKIKDQVCIPPPSPVEEEQVDHRFGDKKQSYKSRVRVSECSKKLN